MTTVGQGLVGVSSDIRVLDCRLWQVHGPDECGGHLVVITYISYVVKVVVGLIFHIHGATICLALIASRADISDFFTEVSVVHSSVQSSRSKNTRSSIIQISC